MRARVCACVSCTKGENACQSMSMQFKRLFCVHVHVCMSTCVRTCTHADCVCVAKCVCARDTFVQKCVRTWIVRKQNYKEYVCVRACECAHVHTCRQSARAYERIESNERKRQLHTDTLTH